MDCCVVVGIVDVNPSGIFFFVQRCDGRCAYLQADAWQGNGGEGAFVKGYARIGSGSRGSDIVVAIALAEQQWNACGYNPNREHCCQCFKDVVMFAAHVVSLDCRA